MYELHRINFKETFLKFAKNKGFQIALLLVVLLMGALYYVEFFAPGVLQNPIASWIKKIERGALEGQQTTKELQLQVGGQEYVSQISYEQAIIDSVKSASPSVVSIVISKNLPVYEQQFINPFGEGSPFGFEVPVPVQKGTKHQEVGAGSGFLVSSDGLVLTNKHVVSDKQADYTVITNEGKKYAAKVVALDPVQDLAIIKIDSSESFPAIKIGDSDGIQIGQGVIAIGNALGEFSNTVSVGVVSGLGRNVSAFGAKGFSENLEGIIQTDAAINPGNSGGPLINLKGEVIGVNTAMADGAQSIGFAIPINIAKKDIEQIVKTNKIVYPFLGVRYLLIDDEVKQKHGLSVDYGALVLKGSNGEAAVSAGSAAEKAGVKEKDVVLEINGQKITLHNSIASIIQQYKPEDKVTLKVLRDGKEINIEVTLGERS